MRELDVETPQLRIIPLGGLGEFGLNMMVYETPQDLFVVDAGLTFPDEATPGVDLIIPDITYIREHLDRLRGIVLTHGHEDHIGALPFLLRDLNCPIYGTPLTLGLVSEKLREHGLLGKVPLIPVDVGHRITLGRTFEVEFIAVTHSILDGAALAIETPLGPVIHTGDFKIDHTPVDGRPFDFHRFSQYGQQGVLVLLSDSTNAEREGHALSEREVGQTLEQIVARATQKVIVATFSSNVPRIQQVLDVAARHGRKVVITGRSMLANVRIAEELGYLRFPPGLRAQPEDLAHLPPHRVIVLTTGSQGEPMSALARMATNEHSQVRVEPGDIVVISARVIPGNERAIGHIINHLFRRGADVIYESVSDIHVSGHAYQEEQRLMINLVRPQYFIPIHGEYRHLVYHARLAREILGEDRVFILENGEVACFTPEGVRREGRVPAGRVFVDGKRVGDVEEVVLRDRQHLGSDGVVIAWVGIEQGTGKAVLGPEVITRGVVSGGDEEILALLQEAMGNVLDSLDPETKSEAQAVGARLAQVIRAVLVKRLDRRPLIIPIVFEV